MANGLLDFLQTPEGQGLLSAAFGGLAGARRGAPLNSLGRAGVAGIAGYGGALERNAQLEQMKQMGGLRDVQMQQANMSLEQMRREQEKAKFLEDQAKGFYRAGAPASGANFPAIESDLPPEMRTGLPAMTPTQAKPAGFDMPGYMGAVAQRYPLEALRMQQQAAAANELKLGPDETVIDRTTGKPKFTGTGKQTDDLREYNYALQNGYKGSLQDWIVAQKKAGAPNTSIKVDTKVGEGIAAQIGPMAKDSFVQTQGAVKMFDSADRLERALESNKVSAGPFAQETQTVKQFIQRVAGGNDENIRQTGQAIRSLAQMSVEARKQLIGQGQVTEREAAAVGKAEAGDINTLTVGELRDLVTLTKRAAHFQAMSHQQFIDNMGTAPETKSASRFYKVRGIEPLLGHDPKLPQIGGGVIDFNSLK